jgi:hypothetical protein
VAVIDRALLNHGAGGRAKYNNCWEFVEHLVSMASDTNAQLVEPNSYDNRQANSLQSQKLANKLLGQAYAYDYINNGFGGFKDKLTMGFQGAGVYGHVLLQAGFHIMGDGIGQVLGAGFDAYDKFQQQFPGIYPHREMDQRPAEIAGNEAGWQVGKHIWNYLTGHRDANVLRNQLTETLCVPDGGT